MSSENRNILNRIMLNWPKGTVATLDWFRAHGGYQQLIDYYQKAPWVKKIGRGAYIKYGDAVDWTGGLWAIQMKYSSLIYAGGKTALDLAGYMHNLQLGSKSTTYLFTQSNQKLPTWFLKHSWANEIKFKKLNLFKSLNQPGMMEFELGEYRITGSEPERAILEMCALVPQYHSFEELRHYMESLMALRVDKTTGLLETCTSVKAKRVFLYLADTLVMPWFDQLNLKRVNLGTGKRQIIQGGKLNKKYNIIVPNRSEIESLENLP